MREVHQVPGRFQQASTPIEHVPQTGFPSDGTLESNPVQQDAAREETFLQTALREMIQFHLPDTSSRQHTKGIARIRRCEFNGDLSTIIFSNLRLGA